MMKKPLAPGDMIGGNIVYLGRMDDYWPPLAIELDTGSVFRGESPRNFLMEIDCAIDIPPLPAVKEIEHLHVWAHQCLKMIKDHPGYAEIGAWEIFLTQHWSKDEVEEIMKCAFVEGEDTDTFIRKTVLRRIGDLQGRAEDNAVECEPVELELVNDEDFPDDPLVIRRLQREGDPPRPVDTVSFQWSPRGVRGSGAQYRCTPHRRRR